MLRYALVSLNQVWEDKEANQKLSLKYLEICKRFELDLVIFPEMTLTGFSMNTFKIAEDFESSDTVYCFKEQAKFFNTNIVFGVVLKSNGKSQNNLICVSKSGEVLANYSKIHPFSYSSENEYYEAGYKIKSIDLDGINIGFSVCYDLRFPEIFQSLSKNCEVIINIANWPKKRIDHWNTLLKARAIENQVFMIGVNRTGVDGNKIEYVKSSMIFNPNGDKLDPIFSNDSLDIFEIEPSEVKIIRNSFPVKNDRKTEFYKSIL